MELSAKAASVQDIAPWRDLYRQEMNCQIVHDSLHSRKGWTQSYLLIVGGAIAGYGAIVVGGPWKGKAHGVRVLRRAAGPVARIRSLLCAANRQRRHHD